MIYRYCVSDIICVICHLSKSHKDTSSTTSINSLQNMNFLTIFDLIPILVHPRREIKLKTKESTGYSSNWKNSPLRIITYLSILRIPNSCPLLPKLPTASSLLFPAASPADMFQGIFGNQKTPFQNFRPPDDIPHLQLQLRKSRFISLQDILRAESAFSCVQPVRTALADFILTGAQHHIFTALQSKYSIFHGICESFVITVA